MKHLYRKAQSPALHTQLSLYAVSSVSGIATPFWVGIRWHFLNIDSNADGEERSVMAQIYVFGRVMHELTPKESQSKQRRKPKSVSHTFNFLTVAPSFCRTSTSFCDPVSQIMLPFLLSSPSWLWYADPGKRGF